MTDIKTILSSKVGHLNQHLVEVDQTVKKKSKFGNKVVQMDGLTFDSQGECTRYLTLRMQERAGDITNLQHHAPVYELNPSGEFSYTYEPDFTYNDHTGKFIVEDYKGVLTAEFKKKMRLMKELYGIDILLTGKPKKRK